MNMKTQKHEANIKNEYFVSLGFPDGLKEDYFTISTTPLSTKSGV